MIWRMHFSTFLRSAMKRMLNWRKIWKAIWTSTQHNNSNSPKKSKRKAKRRKGSLDLIDAFSINLLWWQDRIFCIYYKQYEQILLRPYTYNHHFPNKLYTMATSQKLHLQCHSPSHHYLTMRCKIQYRFSSPCICLATSWVLLLFSLSLWLKGNIKLFLSHHS